MTQFNESGQRDPVQFERFNRSFEFAHQASEKAASERSALWVQLNALHRDYLKGLIPELKHLADLQTRLLVALREELDVGGDIELFRQIMKIQMERMEHAIGKFDDSLFGKSNNGSDG